MSNPVGQVQDFEGIFAALFALLVANSPTWPNEQGNDGSFVALSRVPVPLASLGVGQAPLLYVEQKPFEIKPAIPTVGGRYRYSLGADLVVVIPNTGAQEPLGQETVIPVRELNRAVAAVIGAIQPPFPGAKQDLGGLVDSVYVEGRVELITGLPGQGVQLSVGIIPVTILTI